ncbi:MAG: hypothetical protein KAV82_02790 [Phycisphaerae bacterium]|nr:hypothetical protein [Phycisphaerae bacterium]
MKETHAILMTLVIILAGLGGCTDPRAEAPTQVRLDRIKAYGGMMRDRENQGPERLAATVKLIEEQIERDAAHLDRDLSFLQKWSRRDRRRWNQRQARYRADFLDQLDGNPQLANDMIPRMFY